MKKLWIFLLTITSSVALTQSTPSDFEEIIYKQIDTIQLRMEVYYPPAVDESVQYPAIVFFFGGGWRSGSIKHFEMQAKYFAKRGMICFLADYRVSSRHGTSIFECVMDAKSAVRYVRDNAAQFNVDPDKIVSSGGSAGGHLALSTAMISAYDDPTDKTEVSAKPNAMILFNPVVDMGPTSPSLFDALGDDYKAISPLHNISRNIPPSIIFQGTQDQYTPNETIKYFELALESLDNRCDLFLYEGQKHGFFNFRNSEEYYLKTVAEADKFLVSLGYLSEL